jgi:peroxiredoxin
VIATTSVTAGEFNPTLSIGDQAPSFEGLVGTDGKPHGLADLADKAAVVVIFTCNSCPTAVDYEDRIIELNKKWGDRVGVVAINSNRIEADSLAQMTSRAEQKGFTYPYVKDETQAVARAYGAIYTPEFFVLNKDRKVVYMGALDDKTDASQVSVRYVEAALQAAADGKSPEVAETVARGCAIRFQRTRTPRNP